MLGAVKQQLLSGGQSASTQQLPGARHEGVSLEQKTSLGAHGPQLPVPSHEQFVHSVQLVPMGAKPSGGQSGLLPGQVSATSQSLAAARQVVPEENASAGQPGPEPSQDSGTSQTPALARQVPEVANASDGQAAEAPVQFSATSQTPALGRQVVVEGTN